MIPAMIAMRFIIFFNTKKIMSYKVGDIVPYRNTRGNVKHAKITSFETVDNGKIWFQGIDTVTGAKVWYPVHKSEKLELQTNNE